MTEECAETKEINSIETPELAVDPKESALVLIEYQNEFTTEGGLLHDAVKESMAKTKTLENSKELLDACRAAGCTVIHVPISYDQVSILLTNYVETINFNCSASDSRNIFLSRTVDNNRVTEKSTLILMGFSPQLRKMKCSRLEPGERKSVIS